MQPSRIFLALMCGVYALALLMVFLLPLAAWASYSLAILLCVSGIYYLRRDVMLTLPASCIALRLLEDKIILYLRDGNEVSGQVLAGSVVTPLLSVLNVRSPGESRSRSVLIFADSLARERFRELRVYLKWRT